MKKKILLVIITTTMILTSKSQNLNFEWAKSMGGASDDYGFSITMDPIGNIYTTGYFQGTVDFDPGIGTYNLSSAGNKDFFIQKLNSNGDFVWAKSVGGVDDETGYSITIDATGNVYITGRFRGTVDFDPGLGIYNLTSTGYYDIFVQKLDANGNFEWTKNIGGLPLNCGYSLVTDVAGDVYITGDFQETADFDPGVGTFNLTSNGGRDVFVLKLNSSGDFVWAKSMGGTSDDTGYSIIIDATGNIYSTGRFQGTVDFDPGAGTFNLTSNGSNDVFVQKLDANGNFIWAKKIGGTNTDSGLSIEIDATGNVYTVGSFSGTIDFDPGAGTYNLTSLGSTDIFVLKLDANGSFVWAKSMGDSGNDTGQSIATDEAGNIYITGQFRGTVDFDPGAGTFNLTSNGSNDVFVQKLDANGNFVWAINMGSTNLDTGHSITTDVVGNVYTLGTFRGTVDFDPGTGVHNLTSIGNLDIFVQKMSQCNASSGIDTQTACGSYQWIDGNTYTASNNTATHIIVGGAVSGCDSIVTLNLTINPLPTVTTTTIETTITADEANATYHWLDCNNENISILGETGQSFIASTNGNYSVVIDNGMCIDTSECVSIMTVGIDNIGKVKFIKAYPNPTSSVINFTVQTNLQLSNAVGQVIETKFNVNSIDLSDQPSGIYFINIMDNKAQITQRIKIVKK